MCVVVVAAVAVVAVGGGGMWVVGGGWWAGGRLCGCRRRQGESVWVGQGGVMQIVVSSPSPSYLWPA